MIDKPNEPMGTCYNRTCPEEPHAFRRYECLRWQPTPPVDAPPAKEPTTVSEKVPWPKSTDFKTSGWILEFKFLHEVYTSIREKMQITEEEVEAVLLSTPVLKILGALAPAAPPAYDGTKECEHHTPYGRACAQCGDMRGDGETYYSAPVAPAAPPQDVQAAIALLRIDATNLRKTSDRYDWESANAIDLVCASAERPAPLTPDEPRYVAGTCPTCGAQPAQAERQVAGADEIVESIATFCDLSASLHKGDAIRKEFKGTFSLPAERVSAEELAKLQMKWSKEIEELRNQRDMTTNHTMMMLCRDTADTMEKQLNELEAVIRPTQPEQQKPYEAPSCCGGAGCNSCEPQGRG